MKTFLQIVAQDLYQRLNGRFEQLTIVFPNKRAGLFFNQALADLIPGGRPLWAPTYTTISEIFQHLSQLTTADPIELVCRLYPIYLQATGKTPDDESLDHFYSWGEMMLHDFDDLDNNLVPAEKLYANIEDLSHLTTSDYLEEEQRQALNQFFHNFRAENEHTDLKNKFRSIWDCLLNIYTSLREHLRAEGLAYTGMLKREVVERLPLIHDLDGRTYAFVGFNVLGATETALFSYLKNNPETPTYFYWDYDLHYLDPEHDITLEAGRFIRENIKKLGGVQLDPQTTYKGFDAPKDITFVSSPTEVAGACYAGSHIAHETEGTEALNQNAIVLCNESLLQPLLHALPADLQLNVTMGYPMQQTPICGLLNTLIDLQLRGFADPHTCRYASVVAVLKHPYTSILSPKCKEVLDAIRRDNILYPSVHFLGADDTLHTLFAQHTTQHDLLDYLGNVCSLAGRHYADQPRQARDSDSQLYTEAIFNAYTMINRLRAILEKGLLNVRPDTLCLMLRQIMAGKNIAFHGEPAIGVQVMGVLETRNLDFQNLIMLSVNEGRLPGKEQTESFIPYTLRAAYGMTTIEKQGSLYAYYFYRLLQRARHITLVYNSSTEGLSKGEMSRFMRQMLTDRSPQEARTHPIRFLTLTGENRAGASYSLQIEKTPDVIARLKARYDWSGGRASLFSPTAINTYIGCPLQFYLKYVAGLKKEDEVSEEIGNDVFGNVFHCAMELIYRRMGNGKDIQAPTLIALSRDEAAVGDYVDQAFNLKFFKVKDAAGARPRYNGVGQLNREVIIRYVQNQLRYDATLCPLSVLSVEDNSHAMTIDITAFTGEKLKLRLGGIIDRIDRITDGTVRQYRIVDYKTGAHPQTAASLDALFDSRAKCHHLMQALYYADVVSQKVKEPIGVALMYVKSVGNADKTEQSKYIAIGTKKDKTFINDYAAQVGREYHALLQSCLGRIFSDEPFTQAPTEEPCSYCDFIDICRRNIEKGSK